jgi:hypothetical protein
MKKILCFLFHRGHWRDFPIAGMDGSGKQNRFITIGDLVVCLKCNRVVFRPLNSFGIPKKDNVK